LGRDETCPFSTGRGTRRVQLVREGGGGGGERGGPGGLRGTCTVLSHPAESTMLSSSDENLTFGGGQGKVNPEDRGRVLGALRAQGRGEAPSAAWLRGRAAGR